MDLPVIWFVAIAILWTGYFVLEGFDFGVGALLPVVGRDNTDRRVMINSIGPVWDGNEVWLITAVGAMFAAFPAWYASMLSGLYLPLLLILLALIVRGVAFEYRGKVDTDRWRAAWDRAIVAGSVLPAVLWGVVFGNLVRGLRVDADQIVVGGLSDLLNPYSLLGGLTTLALFTLHGAVFLTLKTDGPVRRRARTAVLRTALAAVPLLAVFLAWTQFAHGRAWTAPLAALAAIALVAGVLLAARGREGWSFAATATAIAAATALLFGSLFPDVLPSTIDPAYNLTVRNAASAEYTLTVISWVTLVALPVVIGYQAWSYWVFRRRVTREHIEPAPAYGGHGGAPGPVVLPAARREPEPPVTG
ncbi:cytochrome d ubiquinol oxidase subunit II [Marinitenerispora sediminis]|uniref:Cytochrome d ubiquinol oxidase subunit II n=1 Tax=Marinitenerispora sediminis TaxID=1931232 RepID=A0A368TBF7_9ACTN|nr:cytochrome d ubiquinol oxidase subunit II [Marinitenerispora sediminis]RCV54032.1 cytochrome d ubiquinol oxidase subunit II [Marinitenerispora sediminis]RCV60817.1 cytochrome d ubiquinol oxidase subunit II [Marinitenerispora sediminis]RCV62448.1 cytochrome d ubiquinol oxidase subunit II [Marinitenerispora sediminis]